MSKILEFKKPGSDAPKKVIPDFPTLNSFEEAVEQFKLDAEAKNLSKETIPWYLNKLKYLGEFLKEIKKEFNLNSITPEDLKTFNVHLFNLRHNIHKDSGLSPQTIKGIVRTVKIFFKFLFEEGYIQHNPSARIKIPKVPKKVIKPLSEEQVLKLFSVIDKRKFSGFRDYLMILILAGTGIRISELLNLKLKDINFSSRTFYILGKGRKEREVPYGIKVAKNLPKYLKWRGTMSPEDYLFVNKSGKRLSRRRSEEIITDYGKKANIEGVRVSPHTFRHTFSLNWIKLGGDILTLQKILGHTTMEMVRNYVNLAPGDITLKHNKYSFIDKLDIP